SGNGQTGTVSQALSNPFTVKVTDASGNPISGTAVTFAITSGGGTLSAAQVTTSSLGLASATLTLGPTAGTNTVTASSGSLTGSPVAFSATAATGSSVFTWTKKWTNPNYDGSMPGFNQWLNIIFDPVSQQVFHYGIRGNSNSIYSTDVFFYNSATNLWTHLG